MKHLVIGMGEVGSALREILDCDGYDSNQKWVVEDKDKYDIIHICFGYQPEVFEAQVKKYQQDFLPKYMVVHSTVPIGTCRKNGWTHSPIRGKHPNLKQSILTFKKYVAGVNAAAVADELIKFGIKCIIITDADDTEAGKLYDLLQFAASILLSKHIYKTCKENGLNFDVVYRNFNKTYNEGYKDLNAEHFTRPILEYFPGPIGGHCVIPMMSLLDDQLAKDIISVNQKL